MPFSTLLQRELLSSLGPQGGVLQRTTRLQVQTPSLHLPMRDNLLLYPAIFLFDDRAVSSGSAETPSSTHDTVSDPGFPTFLSQQDASQIYELCSSRPEGRRCPCLTKKLQGENRAAWRQVGDGGGKLLKKADAVQSMHCLSCSRRRSNFK